MSEQEDLWRGEREYRSMKFGVNEYAFNKNKEKVRENIYSFILGVLAVGIVLGAMVLFVLMFTNTPRTDKATKYDLNCVTELNENPLAGCKEGSEK